MQITQFTNTVLLRLICRRQIILGLVPGDLPMVFQRRHWKKK